MRSNSWCEKTKPKQEFRECETDGRTVFLEDWEILDSINDGGLLKNMVLIVLHFFLRVFLIHDDNDAFWEQS